MAYAFNFEVPMQRFLSRLAAVVLPAVLLLSLFPPFNEGHHHFFLWHPAADENVRVWEAMASKYGGTILADDDPSWGVEDQRPSGFTAYWDNSTGSWQPTPFYAATYQHMLSVDRWRFAFEALVALALAAFLTLPVYRAGGSILDMLAPVWSIAWAALRAPLRWPGRRRAKRAVVARA